MLERSVGPQNRVVIKRVGPDVSASDLDALTELLLDAVAGNASVGFPAGLSRDEARAFWIEVAQAVGADRLILLAARIEGRIVGTVQLGFARFPNGRHRAEVAKLLVHSSVRRRGLATDLMNAAEEHARDAARTLLFLDTETGSAAEALYRKLGWTAAGVIPDFAYRPDGRLRPTTFFYKVLPPTETGGPILSGEPATFTEEGPWDE
ncbi:MAG TPA: GNAT family N-acetyltransferase [Candidatus Dormibacteraeota bacterium]|nr:GNAT family N-acetyltransferase [Candidatus Dormibacteraeota bacterium]